MDTSSLVGDYLSPESTVTSLLSASGRLRSSLRPPERSSCFTYREKVYDSASAALDAYITDFEHCRTTELLTESLVLPHNDLSTPRKPRVAMLRNKDVLRERLTEKELDFLSLPVVSLHHRSNRDRLSMTTDELLSIPYDGSQPVTHTSAYIQGLLSWPGAPQHHPSSPVGRPAHTAHAGLTGSHCPPHHQCPHCAVPSRNSRFKGRREGDTVLPAVGIASLGSFKCGHRAARGQSEAQPSLSLHLPHWLTSNKADMDCSGISSVPDLEYPAWIEHCGLSQLPPPSELKPWDGSGLALPAAGRTGAPSWVADLEEEAESQQTPAQVCNQTLGELRLQFAEQISQLATERQGCTIALPLFTDGKIESLIQKADEVLTSLSQSSAAAEGAAHPATSSAVSPVNKAQPAFSSPSCCPPLSRDSTARDSPEVPEEKALQAGSCSSDGGGAWKQPGPAEALKQMLFRLQAVEAELQRQQTLPAPVPTDRPHTAGLQLSAEEDPKLQSFAGRPSLQRALYHLSRLKRLVQEPAPECSQAEGEKEEKEEDAGGHCASSADGLLCCEQGVADTSEEKPEVCVESQRQMLPVRTQVQHRH